MKDKNIIGPFNLNDWNILRDLKGSVEYLSSYGITGFTPVIEKNKVLYKEYLRKYIYKDPYHMDTYGR